MEAQMIDSPSALKTFIGNLPDCREAPIETSSASATKRIETMTTGISLHVTRNVGTVGVLVTEWLRSPGSDELFKDVALLACYRI
jgi:hypothetical protein